MKKSNSFLLPLALAAIIGWQFAADAAENVSALKALKVAQSQIRDEVENNVVSIKYADEPLSLNPPTWTITIYDPLANKKTRIIKMIGKEIVSQMESRWHDFKFARAEDVIDMEKVKVDSDEAIEAALKSEKLKDFKPDGLKIWLRRTEQSSLFPVWRIEFFGGRNKDSDDHTVTAWVSAVDAQVIKVEFE